MKNRWVKTLREIRLTELMKLLPDDEIVIIFGVSADPDDEDQALYNGTVIDWWKELAATGEMEKLRVNGFRSVELRDTIGPCTMIEVY